MALSQLQEKLLDMLKWFDRYCRENDLRYYALGGTLLGAVRHGGFIPWDDDIDVGMPRPDYERLSELLGTQVHDHYLLETAYSDDAAYCYPFSKLYDTNTTMIENVRSKLKRGIYIDIFPLDGAGADREEGIACYHFVARKYNLYLARIAGIRKGRSFYKNAAVRAMGLIPNALWNKKKQRIAIDRACRRYDYAKSRCGGNLLGNWGDREIVDMRYFGTPTEQPFEDMRLLCVEDYDSYLTCIYGDWRKLPPKEKQVSHHDYLFCDLNQSYLE